MGSMLLHEIPDAADAGRLLDEALDHGVNSIDTANVYVPRRERGTAGTAARSQRATEPFGVGDQVPCSHGR